MKVVIIGGGAGGMMAAMCAARKGAHVTLLDPNERIGKKVNITGKGRCNVTNDSTCEELLAHVPQNPRFLYSAFSRFDGHAAIDFFEGLGVPLKVERGKRVFPVSDRSFDITAALERELLNEAVLVPLFFQQQQLLISPKVSGLVFDPFGPTVDLTWACKSR